MRCQCLNCKQLSYYPFRISDDKSENLMQTTCTLFIPLYFFKHLLRNNTTGTSIQESKFWIKMEFLVFYVLAKFWRSFLVLPHRLILPEHCVIFPCLLYTDNCWVARVCADLEATMPLYIKHASCIHGLDIVIKQNTDILVYLSINLQWRLARSLGKSHNK